MLPEEDGLSITKKLRNNPKYRDMPIVMVTAKDSEMDYVSPNGIKKLFSCNGNTSVEHKVFQNFKFLIG